MDNLTAVAVIIGVVRGITLGLEKLDAVKMSSLLGFILAVVTGIVLGLLHFFGLTVESGIVSALVATGVYQTAKKVGGL